MALLLRTSPTSSSKDDLLTRLKKGVMVTTRVRLKLLILMLTPTCINPHRREITDHTH